MAALMTTASTTAPAPQGHGYLIALGCASFASSAALRLCDAMLPALALEFHVSLAQAAWTTSSYALAYGLLQLVYGTLGDRHGKWRVVTNATLACTVGNALAALAPGIEALIAARILSGATAAAIIPLSMALIGDRVPVADRQVVLGRYLTATISGMIAGQWASGLFADTLGWRWAFGVWAGLFAAIGLHMLVNARAEWQAPVAAGTPPAFVASVLQVLREPRAQGVLVFTVAQSALAFGVVTFIPAFLHHEFGLSLRAAAGVVVLYGVGGLAYSWAVAGHVNRLGPARVMAAAGVALCIGTLGLVAAPHWAWALPACFVAGLAYYAMQSLLNVEATMMVPALRGTSLSLFAAALFAGIALGVSLGAAAIGAWGYRPLFAFSALAVVGLGALYGPALARRPVAAA